MPTLLLNNKIDTFEVIANYLMMFNLHKAKVICLYLNEYWIKAID